MNLNLKPTVRRASRLGQIPVILFGEFSLRDADDRASTFHLKNGDTTVNIAPAHIVSPERPCTLVLKDFRCARGVHNFDALYVVPWALGDADMDPEAGIATREYAPILVITTYADTAPRPGAEWKRGRGFRFEEGLATNGTAVDGFDFPPSYAELEFLERLLERSRALDAAVTRRWHWEHEWNPSGSYLHRHEFERKT